MTARIYYKIQNAYALSGNQPYKFVSLHMLGEKVISKVFLELTAQKC